jgi:hypothetical protein
VALTFSSSPSLGMPASDVVEGMKRIFRQEYGLREGLSVEDTGGGWFRCCDYASGSDYVVAYYGPDGRCKSGRRLRLVIGRPKRAEGGR